MCEARRDKNLFFYGRPFHLLIDGLNRPQRAQVAALMPEHAYVLDIGCGTGELALALRASRNCRVVGVDLSSRMIDYASRRNPYPEVRFLHGDAADIPDFPAKHFDYAVLCMILHELPRDVQTRVLREALRLARATLLLDYSVPMPTNLSAAIARAIETTLGRDHYPHFQAYLQAGGLGELASAVGASSRISQCRQIPGRCHQVIVLGESSPGSDRHAA
jgi:SAM-dependent methyltransferase